MALDRPSAHEVFGELTADQGVTIDDDYLNSQLRISSPDLSHDTELNGGGLSLATHYSQGFIKYREIFANELNLASEESGNQFLSFGHEDFLDSIWDIFGSRSYLRLENRNVYMINHLQQLGTELHDSLWFVSLAVSSIAEAGPYKNIHASELLWSLFTQIILRLKSAEELELEGVERTFSRLIRALPTTTAYPHHYLAESSSFLEDEIIALYGSILRVGFGICSSTALDFENVNQLIFKQMTRSSQFIDNFSLKAYILAHIDELSTLRRAQQSGKVYEFNDTDGNALASFLTEERRIFDVPSQLLTKHFFGRQNELLEISESYFAESEKSTIFHVVSGLEGMGKTQLILEFTTFLFELSPKHHCFWLCAASGDHFRRGVQAMCRLLNTQNVILPDFESQILAIKVWLRQISEKGHSWTLVVDAFQEDEEVEKHLRQLLPSNVECSHILFTTRTENVACLKRLIGVDHKHTPLDVVNPEDALRILFSAAGMSGGHIPDDMYSDATRIVLYLEQFPMAVKQAGAYLKRPDENNTKTDLKTFSKTLSEIEWSFHEHDRVGRKASQKNLPTKFAKALEVTLHLTLTRISRFPRVESLLQILAFLDPENIPFSTLLETLSEDGSDFVGTLQVGRATRSSSPSRSRGIKVATAGVSPMRKVEYVTIDLLSKVQSQEGIITELLNTSLVGRRSARHRPNLRMHDRVAELLLERMDSDTQQSAFSQAVELILNVFEPLVKDLERSYTWSECEVLAPHFKSLIEKSGLYGCTSDRLWRAYLDFGLFFNFRGDYTNARSCYERCLHVFEMNGELYRSEIRIVRYRLARVLMRLAKFSEAIKHILTLLDVDESKSVQITSTNLQEADLLARWYYSQGLFDKAEDTYDCIRNIRKRAITHPDATGIADTLEGIANVRQRRGDVRQAAEMYSRVVAIKKRSLGVDYLALQRARYNLARCYRDQGKFKEAITIFESVRENMSDVLGETHPETQRIDCRLAFTYANAGNLDEAERKASAIKARLEKDESQYATYGLSCTVLATIAKRKGCFEDAQILLAPIILLYQDKLGENHPTTLYVKCEYSDILQKLHDLSGAISILEKIPESSRQGAVATRLAILYDIQAQNMENGSSKDEMLSTALQIAKINHDYLKKSQGLSEVHSVDMSDCMWALARISLHREDFQAAVEYYESAERGWKRLPNAMFGDLKDLRHGLNLARKACGKPELIPDVRHAMYKYNPLYTSLDPEPPYISDATDGWISMDPNKTVASQADDEDLMEGVTIMDRSYQSSISDMY